VKLDPALFRDQIERYKDIELELMLRHLEFEPGQRSLEIGCTDTPLSHVLQDRGVEAWGVDLSDYGFPLQHFLKGDFLVVDLPQDYFDIAIDVSALHHFGIGYIDRGGPSDLDADIKAADKIFRALRQGGAWYIVTDRYGPKYQVGDWFRVYDVESFKARVAAHFTLVEMIFYNMAEEPVGEDRGEILYAKLVRER